MSTFYHKLFEIPVYILLMKKVNYLVLTDFLISSVTLKYSTVVKSSIFDIYYYIFFLFILTAIVFKFFEMSQRE